MSNGKEIVKERDDEYGNVSYWHGRLFEVIPRELREGILQNGMHGFFFPWHLIFNKLLRALKTPMNRDHWIDIQGYAQLAINNLEEIENEGK